MEKIDITKSAGVCQQHGNISCKVCLSAEYSNGDENKEQKYIKEINIFLDGLNMEEIGAHSSYSNQELISFSRSNNDIKIENGKAFFEIPITHTVSNDEVSGEEQERMVLKCQIDLNNNSIVIVEKQDEDGNPYDIRDSHINLYYNDAVKKIQERYKELE